MKKNQHIIEATRRWITTMVIGLNLCPFARRVFEGDRIRFVVSEAEDRTTLLIDLLRELSLLDSVPISKVETTLLIHPFAYQDFLEYNDFLDDAERQVENMGMEGIIQIASFHPQYQFADTEPDAPENYTNRSPYPMLHLLREESITAIADDPDGLLEIPRRNIETLNQLGREKILALLKAIEGDSAKGTQP